ncbi:hypothetical protein VM1G_05745 [Cytospora mali]|uniref:Uncharacterized protein n=1 Tax=Cytospora mali TaxID=578113 RepID=A0A194W0W8_CYTMA|nr:hypothetical protein VM1G_05745 [Valsa mali]
MYDFGSQRDDVPFLPLLLGLAAWPICRIFADRFVRWYNPEFYKHLRSDYEKRYLFFLGVLLGLVAKLPSLIGCGLAVWKTAPEDDIAGFRKPMNPYQQFCWGSRAVIYISELPHYLHLPEMVLHHFLALSPMAVIARYYGPRRGYDLALAALCAEPINNLRALLKQTHYSRNHPDLDWRLQFYGTIVLFITRVPTAIMSIAMIPANGLHGVPAHIALVPYIFNLVYVHRITYKRLRNTDILQVDDSGVFRVRIGNHFNITSTSLLTGVAILSTQMSVIALYTWIKTEPIPATTSELISLSCNSLFAVAIGLAGSRIVASPLQRIFQWQRVSSVYLQSGLVFAIIFLCTSPTIDTTIDKEALVACLLLSSSLTKAISQYASHLACIESGSQVTAKQDDKGADQTELNKVVPSQASLYCSVINLFQYLVLGLAVVTGYFSPSEAALKTVLVQFVIRATVDSTLKNSGKRLTTLTSLAILNTLWRIGGVATASVHHLDPNGNSTIIRNAFLTTPPFMPPDWRVVVKFAVKDMFMLGGLYGLVSATTSWFSAARYPLPAPLPKLRTVTLVSLAVWFCYIGYAAWKQELPEVTNKGFTAAEIVARQPPICSLLLTWQFWVSITTSVSMSTMAAHLWLPKTVSQAKNVQSDSFWDQE